MRKSSLSPVLHVPGTAISPLPHGEGKYASLLHNGPARPADAAGTALAEDACSADCSAGVAGYEGRDGADEGGSGRLRQFDFGISDSPAPQKEKAQAKRDRHVFMPGLCAGLSGAV